MSLGLYRVRRATLDDLPALLAMWTAMHLPIAELERHLTEFQIIENEDGHLLGAIALEVIGRQGRLHNEAFTDFSLADALREQLWARMQSVADNLGLARLWTGEAAPFWKRNGLLPATGDTLKKLPEAWSSLQSDWLTLQLRDEVALQTVLEKQFTRFQEEEKLRREEILQKARVWKYCAFGLVTLIVGAGIFICIYLLLHRRELFRH